MSVQGHRPKAIRSTIISALNGQTITGDSLEETLNQADDAFSPLIGSRECVKGAFVVLVDYRSMDTATTYSASGTVQRMYGYNVRIQAAIDIACRPELISTDLLVWSAAMIDLIDAALEPVTGSNLNVQSVTAPMPQRAPGGSLMIVEVIYTIRAFWSRS